mmetsp:Transcript_42648/g.166462  ORF Transcript_42648/g.166462 Transcript_42648/m.166462 type:complete len:242 (-) Transcript_42648:1814-2539(-)
MRERVLKTIRKLESIHVAQTVLDVAVNDQLGQPQDLATQMEGVSKPRLLSLLGGQRFDWFQVEIVVQVKIVQLLAMDEQVQHIVPLAANLESGLDPVYLRRLEKLGVLECLEQRLPRSSLCGSIVQLVEYIVLEQLLIAYTDFHRRLARASFHVPVLNERHIHNASAVSGPLVERRRCPVQADAGGGHFRIKRLVLQHRREILWHSESIIIPITKLALLVLAFPVLPIRFLVLCSNVGSTL